MASAAGADNRYGILFHGQPVKDGSNGKGEASYRLGVA